MNDDFLNSQNNNSLNNDENKQMSNMGMQNNAMQGQYNSNIQNNGMQGPYNGNMQSNGMMNNQIYNNGYPGYPPKKNNTLLFIIIGVIVALLIGVVLYFTVFQKDDSELQGDYGDYVKEQEKLEEKLNKNFTVKDYKVVNGILIEVNNKNNEIVDADIKVEFYDASGKIVKVLDEYINAISKKSTSYGVVNLYGEFNYSTYKVTVKLEQSLYKETYNDKIKILSTNVQDEDFIVQVKNNSNVKLSAVTLGILFISSNNSIIGYDEVFFDKLEAGETTSESAMIPYDKSYNTIKYKKTDIKVIYAVAS